MSHTFHDTGVPAYTPRLFALLFRAIVTGDKALLFEPASNNTRKLLDTLVPRLQVRWHILSVWPAIARSCGQLQES